MGRADGERRGSKMERETPSDRESDLLDGVIRHLAAHGIGDATFRSLAQALGISTYPLVYHFGTREQLLGRVVAEIERRQKEVAESSMASDEPPDINIYWDWCVENKDLLRLDMEVLLQEGRKPDSDNALATTAFHDWHQIYVSALRDAGFSKSEALIEATELVALAAGLQLDLVTTGDVDRTTAALRKRFSEFRELLAAGGPRRRRS
ncbi:MAG: TetR/AcrR family transcriptional regulator [Actinobacteria bacterium]|nr:TetR/AcrR family transcriptional regulator [Actinomycetota bacterium]